MLKLKSRLDLQAFAEEAMSGGEIGGTAGNTDPGFADQGDADDDLFSYDGQSNASSASPNENESPDGDDYQVFREKYKDRIEEEQGQRIQEAIQRRFKNQQSYEDSYNSLIDGLAPLFLKYGLDGSDIDGLTKALAEDDSLLEDTAFNEGLTPEAVRERLKVNQENARLQKELDRIRQQQQEEQASRDAYRQFNEWQKEAEELKEIYPNFDLNAELENEEFRDDLVNSGKSLRKVYEAAHLEEIIAGAIQTAANRTRESVINNVKARGMRPAENGTRSGSVSVKKNVNELTDKDIDKIIRRVQAGETISF